MKKHHNWKNWPSQERGYRQEYLKLKAWREAVEDNIDYLASAINTLTERLNDIEADRRRGSRDCEHERKRNNNNA